ncbi:hypothetical protein B1C78_01830 [Thioalkalivibrio denitrificans]|uniref:Retropepsin-like aspartic endopeptidase domain-containing protein n=1 Tax=Thioalkalivibrio denitrificans TaxID=108003 RepID=A0A1V3NU59_9GAMM|nr:hypothetical protein B1C78_01830 [Thioalkalivibrio denitrificans]
MLLLIAATLPVTASASDDDKASAQSIHGYAEEVIIRPEGIRLKARLDTGATSSSLNALNKETFERDDEEWIAFDIIDPEDEDKKIRLERKIVRHARIIRHDGNHQRRPVVSMELCLGEHRREADVSLIDRTALTYQMLIGRNHMKDIILVDSGQTNIQPPRCDD